MNHEGLGQLFVRLLTENFEEATRARREKRASRSSATAKEEVPGARAGVQPERDHPVGVDADELRRHPLPHDSTPVNASALPRISMHRTTHGWIDARSSTTKATWSLPARLRKLPLAPRLWPPMSMVPSSALYRYPTGLFCGAPRRSTVARRPSRCLPRYSI